MITECFCCKEIHELGDCPQFRAMQVDERVKIIAENKLCYRCLRQGHTSSGSLNEVCQRENCSRRHHTFVHSTPRVFTNGPAVEKPVKTDNSKVMAVMRVPTDGTENKFCGTTRMPNTFTLLIVVPVILRSKCREIRTYALLDSASEVTLVAYRQRWQEC